MRNVYLVVVLFVTFVFVFAACSRGGHVYVALSGRNVELVESGEPPRSSRCFCAVSVPLRYSLREPGVSITVALGDEPYVPSFEVRSTVPIHAISVGTTGFTVRRSEFAYKVLWSYWREREEWSPRVGDFVQMQIELEDRAEPILVSGVIAESGTFF